MGHMSSRDMILHGGDTSIEQQLEWHLEYNHYPPVDLRMVPFCKEAIELVASDQGETEILVGDYDTQKEIEAQQIVEDLHLGPWVERMVLALEVDEQDGQT